MLRTDTNATIRLTPSWLARLFGARAYSVDLVWHVESRGWLMAGSRRWLIDLSHDDQRLLQDALDMTLPTGLPRAVATERSKDAGAG